MMFLSCFGVALLVVVVLSIVFVLYNRLMRLALYWFGNAGICGVSIASITLLLALILYCARM
jgi:hypothetical protein